MRDEGKIFKRSFTEFFFPFVLSVKSVVKKEEVSYETE